MIKKISRDKSNLLIFSCTLVTAILLISISIMISSFRQYLINNVKKEIGDYHVIIKSDYIKDKSILNNEYKNNRNYIKYKEINRVYKNTNKICKKTKCEAITYNDSMLSLYGLSNNKNILKVFKSLLYFFMFFFGSIMFFVIYNAYSISTSIKKKNIILYKLAGSDNNYLLKKHFKESLIIGLIAIIIGFIISIILNKIIIKTVNQLLYEIFNGNIKISFYFSFIIVPVIIILSITALCSLIPFRQIKKYKIMELFRKNEEVMDTNIRLDANIIYYLFKINIYRFKTKYRNLTICIFIFCFSFNIIFLVTSYGLKCIKDYVIIPNYDLAISVEGEYNYNKIKKDLKINKKTEFHSCYVSVDIPKEYYNKYEKTNTIITDLGGNKVINTIEKIGKNNKKIAHLKYKRFKKINELTINDYSINNLALTNKKQFGIDGKDTVINLEKEDFKNICPEYNSNLIIKTKYKGIDKYLNNQIRKEKTNMSYLNVKKTKEIINNLIMVLKILLYSSVFLIFLSLTAITINISIFSMYKRKREIATLRSLGFSKKGVIISLLLESMYTSIKGFAISIPFIFIINKYLYMSIKTVFDFKRIIIGYEYLLISYLLCFFIVFLSNYISYLHISKKSLINNIKYEY